MFELKFCVSHKFFSLRNYFKSRITEQLFAPPNNVLVTSIDMSTYKLQEMLPFS